MTQAQERITAQPAIVRSEQFVGRIEQNIGSFAVVTRQRLQQTATRVEENLASIQTELTTRSKVAQGKPPRQLRGKEGDGPVPTGESPQAEIQRAERVVDVMGHRLVILNSKVGFQVRRMAAYAREGTEDMWAEVQYIRSARNHRTGLEN